MTWPLTESREPMATGVEVHPVTGLGWGIFTRVGDALDRQWICATAEEADEFAREYVEDAAPGIIERCGMEPYLKLSGEAA